MGSKNEMVSTDQEDWLKSDPQLRGQDYCLLSMVEPKQTVLDDKEMFYFNEFIKTFSQQMNQLFDELKSEFPDKTSTFDLLKQNNPYIFNYDDLQEEFRRFRQQEHLEDNFAETYPNRGLTRSGVKVRGVFHTKEEAEKHVSELQKNEPKIGIYMGEVGRWLPFNPDESQIEEREYAEKQLNTLMKAYKQNQEEKDRYFEERKNQLKEQAETATTHEVEESIF
jgi:hypothetical protein